MKKTQFDKEPKMYLVKRYGNDRQDIPRASNDVMKRGASVCYRTHQGNHLSVLVFTGFEWGFQYINEPLAKLKFVHDTPRACISDADIDKNKIYVCFSRKQMIANKKFMERKPT